MIQWLNTVNVGIRNQLHGMPFHNLKVPLQLIKTVLGKCGKSSASSCFKMAGSGEHVRYVYYKLYANFYFMKMFMYYSKLF